MTIKTKFGKFLANLELTDAQKQDAETKHTRVRKSLHEAFYPTPYNGTTSPVVGSYGKRTAIRPTNDIDILFITHGNDSYRNGPCQSAALS